MNDAALMEAYAELRALLARPDVPEGVYEGVYVRIPRQCGHRFRRKAATDSDRKRPPDPNEGGHPVDGVIRGALSAV
jgi:hypothetical protein